MSQADPPDNRRRHLRFPLGLPVIIHLDGRDESMAVEIVDIAAKGARFRASAGPLPLHQRASFGFVTADQEACVANGRIVRVGGAGEREGEFVVSVERANPAFVHFVTSLSA
jgi:hypothetical protein